MLDRITAYGQIKSPETYWRSCQIFSPLRIQIASPIGSFHNALVGLRRYGTAVTVAAGRSIAITTASAVQLVISELQQQIQVNLANGKFEFLGFDNYLRIAEFSKYSLENGVWSSNGAVVFDILWNCVFSDTNRHIQQALCPFDKVTCQATRKRKYVTVKENTALIYKGHRTCLKDAHKGRASIPFGWAFLNIPFQAAVADPGVLDAYSKLWTTPAPEVEQRASIESDTSYFVSTDWLNTFVYPAHYYAMKMVASDLAIEEKIVKLLRSEDTKEDEETISKYLQEGPNQFKFADWEPIASVTKGSGKGIRVWNKRFGNIMDKNSSLYPGTSFSGKAEILNRLEALISSLLLKDMFNTIAHYGYNPKLKVDREEDSDAAKVNAVKQYLE